MVHKDSLPQDRVSCDFVAGLDKASVAGFMSVSANLTSGPSATLEGPGVSMTWGEGPVRGIVDVEPGELYTITLLEQGTITVNAGLSDEDHAAIGTAAPGILVPIARPYEEIIEPEIPPEEGWDQAPSCILDLDVVWDTGHQNIDFDAWTGCLAPMEIIIVEVDLFYGARVNWSRHLDGDGAFCVLPDDACAGPLGPRADGTFDCSSPADNPNTPRDECVKNYHAWAEFNLYLPEGGVWVAFEPDDPADPSDPGCRNGTEPEHLICNLYRTIFTTPL